jgi:hypothetical protein
MKKIFAKIFGATGSSIAEKISDIIDKHTFSKVEKAQFEKEMTQVWINAESDIQKNITERWKNDMNSDSWLSKNVRPLVLIFLVFSTVLMVFIDAGVLEFEVKSSWIDLLQLVLITVIGSYFGGRSYEKINRK